MTLGSIPAPAPKAVKHPPYKQITRYDLATGRLLGVGQVDFNAQPEAGQGYLAGNDNSVATQYLNLATDTIEQRLPVGATLSADTITLGQSVTLAPLPIPCTVSVAGVGDVLVDDGELVVTPASIGEAYRLMIDNVMFLREDWFFSVEDAPT
jgi:hypothetical protein